MQLLPKLALDAHLSAKMEMVHQRPVVTMDVVTHVELVLSAKSAAEDLVSVFPTVLVETVVMMDVVETLAVSALLLNHARMEFVLELPPLIVPEDSVVLTELEEVAVHAQLDKDVALDNVNVTMTAMKETVVMPSNPMVPISVFALRELAVHAPVDSLAEVMEDAQPNHPITLLSLSSIVAPDVLLVSALRSSSVLRPTVQLSQLMLDHHTPGLPLVWELSHSNQLPKDI